MECEQIQTSGLLKAFPEGLRGKILEFAIKRENQAYKGTYNILYALRSLRNNGANLYDPESVKETLKNMSVSENTKKAYADNYEVFLNYLGGVWEKPKYHITQKIPFIPTEAELDQLIASLSPRIATFAQVAKDTAARKGEIGCLKWTDIDFEKRLIFINEPEKGSDARVIKVSEKCINMINHLPRKSEKLFERIQNIARDFHLQRARAVYELSNPRLRKITLHTFRHWKATMEYHKTKDIIHVKQLLGHRNIKNTMIYITIEKALFQETDDEFTVNVAKTLEEACKLIEVGFEYVTDMDNAKIFRKRK